MEHEHNEYADKFRKAQVKEERKANERTRPESFSESTSEAGQAEKTQSRISS